MIEAKATQILLEQTLNTLSSKQHALSHTHIASFSGLEAALSKINALINTTVNDILHHDDFQSLEANYRGVQRLFINEGQPTSIRIKLFNISKKALSKEAARSVSLERSTLYKKVYTAGFDHAGAHPFNVLIGAYAFDHQTPDIQSLHYLGQLAEKAFAPFIACAKPSLLGLEDWRSLNELNHISPIFNGPEHSAWQGLREQRYARFITLTLPRVIARPQYTAETQGIDETIENDQDICWMNASFHLAECMIRAHQRFGWTTAIRGREGGGKIDRLPIIPRKQGEAFCPAEVGLSDEQEAELSHAGLLPFCHYKHTDYGVFFGAQTLYKPALYNTEEASANERIAARLPYVLATSRIAHYLKIMARDKIGSFMEASDCEIWLNQWLLNYVNANAGVKQRLKSKFPLAEARVNIVEDKSNPGRFQAVAWLRPWLQLEQLSASLRLVADIPNGSR
ncbi:MAG: type VI secretion system contractile sheath large subunit [Gammaproteobacteria bacterium CG11_big_fil_rev_8_21_14_0_20_46_22]|nr:MAG: type VI secretion system contractile sheath large subunit [Gammaproteobacteria bacterium CG12_big_fil_rev_8_21_14_0_65_46_12]PIR12004.1 MAG: type VI secretion system contractile sheath large subunit [Gammaproteobacteria bacterium CG11_big_fil_rev_8_21_14_0_20_46_22]